jgi:di/tricarboxylate transporter
LQTTDLSRNFGDSPAISLGVERLMIKNKRGVAMKVQNIFRMQAIVIGLGAALFLASPAPAQQIVNTSFNDGPNVATFDQPATPAAGQVSAAGTSAATATAPVPAVAASVPVVAQQAVVSFEDSAQRWLVVSAFFGIMMLALYALAEVRRARKSNERPRSLLERAAFN